MPARLAGATLERAGLPVVPVDLPGATAFVTTRAGGVSAAPFDSLNLSGTVGDDNDAVAENRRRVAAAARVSADRLVLARQVHGARVAVVEGPGDSPEADALVTGRDDLALVVLVADCVPVLLAAADGSRVGVAHAGWRGLAAGVLPAAVHAVGDRGVRAIVGPAISARRYQVGPEVADLFAGVNGALAPDVGDRSRLDLVVVALAQLRACGVDDDRIAVVDAATDDDAFFSARAGSPTGRFGLVAVRTMEPR